MKFIKPFRAGDVVKVRGWDSPGEHIIQEVSVYGVNNYQYATNRVAWVGHTEMRLVRECDAQSIKKLVASKEDEMESEVI